MLVGCGLLILQKLHKRAARIVNNSSLNAPAVNVIRELKWPTAQNMIKKGTANIVFKRIFGLAAKYLYTLFTKNTIREMEV